MKGYINSCGIKLRYQIEGTGIPAIVIGSAHYYPRLFSSHLTQFFQFVFLDHKGFTAPSTPLDKTQYTLDAILDDIELARRQLGLDKIAIIGHSGHGFMALEYAKKYPNAVTHVILIGMGPSNSEQHQQLSEQYFQQNATQARKKAFETDLNLYAEELQQYPERAFITFCLMQRAKSWYDYSYDARSLWADVEVNMPIIYYLWGEVFRDIDITKHAKKVKAPIFLALGKHDYLVAPHFTWEPIRSVFNDLTITLFAQSGHNPQLEEAELFDQLLLDWIEDKKSL